MLSTILETLVLTLLAILPQQEPLGEYWGTGEEEAKYYKLVDVPLPDELAIEAGSFEVMPDKQQLAIATRRGDIFFVEGAFDEHPQPVFKKFASGLDEVMGMAYRNGSFYVTQQTEVTRISDTNQDGRADRFETLSDEWGFRHYHEFAFGSKPDADGNIWVALCLSKSYHSDAPFRGWCLKITPEGKTIPVCSGIRSPCGIGPNEYGVMFYSESQGPWNGSCSLKVLQPGGFMGHPISFNWYELAPEMGPAPVKPNTPSRLETERKRVKELVPYAVVFPYKRMGRSISGFMVDRTGGKFGPFENQIFVADFSLGVIMRTTTEKVNGVWQGACYPFREGFNTGLLAVQFTPQGSLIAGGTNRGWPVRGPKAYAVQRLDWTGIVPFEIKEIKATPTGFNIAFTKPVDPALASLPGTYQLKTFTHIYQQGYGSPEVDQTEPTTTEAVVSKDGLEVQITVDGLVQGHVHDFHLPAIKSADGEKLLHASAYYTLNEIPKKVDKAKEQADKRAQQRIRKRLQATDRSNAGITQGVIDFQRPEDAVQLVGRNGSVFVPEKPNPRHPWTFEDGILTASPKWASVVTPELYRDFRMHVEFNVNDAGDVPTEKNGNSGVYLQKRYELQILNSFGISEEDYTASYCGSLYRQKKPDQLANKPAGQWQTFDIAFRAARFEGQQKTENARITVYQNGKLIHDDYPLKRQTGVGKREQPIALPIKLQGHHNQVRFRNIWIQRLNLDQPLSQTVSKEPVTEPNLPQNERPNIVVILADDLGYGDVGCFNPESRIPTPNLDRMAQHGMRFMDAHSPCTVCTPTRYSLMTGQMAFRIPNGGRVFTGAGGPSLIAPKRLTLPQMLRDKGYATACFGKWHIGMTFEDSAGQPIHKGGLEAVKRIDYSRPIKGGPLDFGFDHFYGTACCPTTDWLYAYIDGNRIPVPPTKQLDKSGLPKHPYANDNRPGMVAPDFDLEEVDMVFLEKSQQFLKEHVANHPDKPFFLFHSAQAVHLPSFPGRQFKGKTKSGPHGDFIFQLDHIVGELMKTLKQLNVDDNTLVIFASDNGPEVPTIYHMRRDHNHDGARPWRGVKRDNWEGGHRIPMIVHWPGKVPANSESKQITSLTDVMATVAEIVDAEIPDNAAEDSFSMLPAMLGTDEGKPIRPYILQQGFGGKRYLAIRRGKWKYLSHKGSGGNNYNNHRMLKAYQLPDTAPEAEGQLFNLETDPGETENLALIRADIANELRELLKETMATGRSRPVMQNR